MNPSRRLSWDSLKAYSNFVALGKFALGASIVLVLVFMVAIPLIGKQKDGVRVAFASIEEKDDMPPIMMQPRFQGVDADNQPYVVTADSALQTGDSTVTLDKVKAELSGVDGTWMMLRADQGILDMTEQSLLLQGDVLLYHSNGTEMHTEQVRLDLQNFNAFSESPVKIAGESGTIGAGRFTVLDKGNRMLFNSGVRVVLSP